MTIAPSALAARGATRHNMEDLVPHSDPDPGDILTLEWTTGRADIQPERPTSGEQLLGDTEHPSQLEDLRNVRLPVEEGAIGIEAAREPRRCYVANVAAQRIGIAHRRQRMVVGNEVQRPVLLDE